MEVRRLAKILSLAASDNDGEALSALRAAKRILAAHGKDFLDLAALVKSAAERGGEGMDEIPCAGPSKSESEALAKAAAAQGEIESLKAELASASMASKEASAALERIQEELRAVRAEASDLVESQARAFFQREAELLSEPPALRSAAPAEASPGPQPPSPPEVRPDPPSAVPPPAGWEGAVFRNRRPAAVLVLVLLAGSILYALAHPNRPSDGPTAPSSVSAPRPAQAPPPSSVQAPIPSPPPPAPRPAPEAVVPPSSAVEPPAYEDVCVVAGQEALRCFAAKTTRAAVGFGWVFTALGAAMALVLAASDRARALQVGLLSAVAAAALAFGPSSSSLFDPRPPAARLHPCAWGTCVETADRPPILLPVPSSTRPEQAAACLVQAQGDTAGFEECVGFRPRLRPQR